MKRSIEVGIQKVSLIVSGAAVLIGLLNCQMAYMTDSARGWVIGSLAVLIGASGIIFWWGRPKGNQQ